MCPDGSRLRIFSAVRHQNAPTEAAREAGTKTGAMCEFQPLTEQIGLSDAVVTVVCIRRESRPPGQEKRAAETLCTGTDMPVNQAAPAVLVALNDVVRGALLGVGRPSLAGATRAHTTPPSTLRLHGITCPNRTASAHSGHGAGHAFGVHEGNRAGAKQIRRSQLAPRLV